MANQEKRITDLTTNNTVSSSTFLPIDNTSSGTGKIAETTLVDNAPATFTTADVADNAVTYNTGWSSVNAMTSGENRKTLLNKISTMMKNLRYLYKLIGTTDIASLSTQHTITGALSTLNTNIGTNSTAINKLNTDLTPSAVSGITPGDNITIDTICCYKVGRLCVLNARLNLTADIPADNSSVFLNGLPVPLSYVKIAASINNGNTRAIILTSTGILRNDWSAFSANSNIFVSAVYATNA